MLTKKQKEILDFIKEYIKDNDYSPSLQEIGKKFKLSSLATVHQHIENLKQKGYLKKEKNHHRSIELSPEIRSLDSIDLVEIPLLGTIAAGQPIEAIEDAELIKVPKSQLSKLGEHYALRVRGDSMIDEGIFNNDTVIIRKQPTAENGETIVALLSDNEVTLKKIYKEKNRFRLQPANPNLKPIFTKELEIQGKVIRIIRTFEEFKQFEQEVEDKSKEFSSITTDYLHKTDIEYRKKLGQYFTPKSVRSLLFSELPKKTRNIKILDPACGTGEFLNDAKRYFKNSELHGWEIDKNLVKATKKLSPESILKNIDSLTDESYDQFDLVIGNPPYFEFSPSIKIKNKFKEVINGRTNIFSLFIYQGIKWLKEGGYLAFVVPPSMNNGAYFSKLRKFIIENCNIEYLHILNDPKIFHKALQSTMLLILKKGGNKGDYLFKKNGIMIFSENPKYLKKIFKNKIALCDLDYEVKTGRLTWNQNKDLLTNNPEKSIPLIWAHNITEEGLNFPIVNDKKPQYVKISNYDIGPAILVNRITGTVKSSKLKAAIIPPKMKFVAENHVNVIFPLENQKQGRINFWDKAKKIKLSVENIANQLSSKEKVYALKSITGNTQISKNELEKLFPISVN